ncbi:formylglycine-generating enzyme family protein [Candidatus Poribacteria bacterium]|nr:formylglycine-generating enzyme family protein [Candidatus Poribacteria bacterium]MYH83926.1 formylglycine-generating enzyme family protein [Candidatus Poribacteria bacterium]MYK96987.1 formylglycine-generating enzyme family protein [Candidatus Poribacteria bacterium]
MSKRDEFITVIRTLKAASPTITDKQRIGLLQQATQNYGLSAQEATEILKDLDLVVGEGVNYFDVLGFSIEEIQSLNENAIVNLVEAAHKKRYSASLRAGGRIRSDGKTEEQWRTLLNRACDTLKNPQQRRKHIDSLKNERHARHTELTGSVPDDMALIPAGEFLMGSNDDEAHKDEKPVHTVYLDAFYMDIHPVTNAQYKAFVDANPQWSKPEMLTEHIWTKYHDGYYLHHWYTDNYPFIIGDHPVVHVSWYAAMAYAQWVGKRLPTEAEWEKAARGGLMNQKYACGNSIDESKANYGRNVDETTPIAKYAENGYGLYDMTGNVFEWCLDKWDKNFYRSSPRNNPVSDHSIIGIINNFTKTKAFRVLRGGSWYNKVHNVRVAARTAAHPTYANSHLGFRCVMDVTP